MVLLAILGLTARAADTGAAGIASVEIAVAFTLLALSIAINGRGALSHATSNWNSAFDIDSHPERLNDWSNPQFMAGLLAPPNGRIP